MADKKISELGALDAATRAATDVLPIVDVSAGETKKITVGQLFTDPVVDGGTANGVAYLNGSKVLTSGSALTFDGAKLNVASSADAPVSLLVVSNATTGGGSTLNIAADSTHYAFPSVRGDTVLRAESNSLVFGTASEFKWGSTGAEYMRLTSTGLGIGTSSPSNTLTVAGNANITGNTTLGDASTDTVTVNGYMGVGGGASSSRAIQVSSSALTGTTQIGILSQPSANSAATSELRSIASFPVVADSAFTVPNVSAFYASVGSKGASAAATNWHGLYISDQTQGTNNYGITSLVSSGTNKWNIYASGTAANYFAGNVGIGTSSPAVKLHVKLGGSSDGVIAESSSNDDFIKFRHDGSLAIVEASYISTGGYTPLTFKTGGTERLRIDTSGNLLVGTTSANPTNGFVTNTNSGFGCYTQTGHPSGTSGGVAYSRFMYAQSEIGSITQSGTTGVLYNITSDQRLKENIQDADSASALIDSLQVRKYDWKADGTHQRYGFIAQELVTVVPEAVHQPEDPEQMMAVDYSKLVPLLVKEIQSLRKRLAAAGIS